MQSEATASIRMDITTANTNIAVLQTQVAHAWTNLAILATIATALLVLFGARIRALLSSLTKNIPTVLRRTSQLKR